MRPGNTADMRNDLPCANCSPSKHFDRRCCAWGHTVRCGDHFGLRDYLHCNRRSMPSDAARKSHRSLGSHPSSAHDDLVDSTDRCSTGHCHIVRCPTGHCAAGVVARSQPAAGSLPGDRAHAVVDIDPDWDTDIDTAPGLLCPTPSWYPTTTAAPGLTLQYFVR